MTLMELSPQAVAAATFKTVKRGYDPDEVRAYLVEVSASLEASHQQATAMEARARAAIAKLQDASQHPGVAVAAHTPAVSTDDSETISRTLLLAQRTADATVADARAEAAQILDQARTEAERLRSDAFGEASARTSTAAEQAERLLREAEIEAERATAAAQLEVQRAKSEAHLRAEAAVARLERQREALLSDVSVLEHHVGAHRDRLRSTSVALAELAERVPDGLGDLARPALAAVPVAPGGANGVGLAATTPTRSLSSGNGAVPAGAEPLVSPRPTSIDEVRSTWAQAEQADLIDATPTPSTGIRLPVLDTAPTPSGGFALPPTDLTPADGMRSIIDATPADGLESDATPPAGIEVTES